MAPRKKKAARVPVPPELVRFSDALDCWCEVQRLTEEGVAKIEAFVTAGSTWLKPSPVTRVPAPVDRDALHLSFRDRVTQEELAEVRRLPWLTSVAISRSYEPDEPVSFVTSFEPLAALTRLRNLTATTPLVTDLEPLAGLTQLETLDLGQLREVSRLEPLRGLTRLRELSVWGGRITDLAALAPLTRLERLNLVCLQTDDLAPLAGHSALRFLDVRHATRLRDLSALASARALEELNLIGTAVLDLSALAGLPLRRLQLDDTHVREIRPLLSLKRLEAVSLPSTVPDDQLAALKTAFPDASVDRYGPKTPEVIARLVADGRMAPLPAMA